MKLLNFSILLFFVSTLFSCGDATVTNAPKVKVVNNELPAGWKTLQSDRFSLSHPADWTADESGQLGAILFLFAPQEGPEDQFSENINLGVDTLSSKSIDLDTYVKAAEGSMHQYVDDAQLISSERLELNGKEFQVVNYEGTQDNVPLRFQQYYIVQDGEAFILTFTCTKESYANYKEIGSQIMQSFRLN